HYCLLDYSISLFSPINRPPPTPPLFPYTTLFRSGHAERGERHQQHVLAEDVPEQSARERDRLRQLAEQVDRQHDRRQQPAGEVRSEEHTSELQSLTNLVCRLLLEKKKTYNEQHEL